MRPSRLDYLDCIFVTGCFMLVYLKVVVAKNSVHQETLSSLVLDMVADLTLV